MEIRCNRYSGCGYGDNGHNMPIPPLLPAAQPGDQLSTAPQSGGGYVIAPCAYPRTGDPHDSVNQSACTRNKLTL